MSRLGRTAALAVVAVVGLACGPADENSDLLASSRAPQNNNYAHVLMTCNTMVGVYEVDPAAAAKVLPAEYTLQLHQSADGSMKGLVYLQTSKCGGTGNGADIGAFDLADAWLIIDGPPEVVDIPGAYFTLPTTYVYVLKAQTTSEWVKENCASIHFAKELVQGLDISNTPPRVGALVESTGKGYQWSEFLPCVTPPGTPWGECWMFPGMPIPVGYGLPALPVGYNIKGFINQGNGQVAKKEMACVMDLVGQGLVQLNVDPKSHLMEAGVFGASQIGLSFDAVAHCDLMMTPL